MEIIKEIQKIGFSKREAEIYIALLQKKEFTAPELAKITTVNRTKIYEILQKIVGKGLCNEKITNGQKIFRAIKPEIIFQKIITNFESDIETQKKETENHNKDVTLVLQKKSENLQRKIESQAQKRISTL